MLTQTIFLGVCIGSSFAFLMTRVDPGIVIAEPGHRISLLCSVDDHWEFCRFISPTGDLCDFEWKRMEGNVTMQKCDLHSKVEFFGTYDDKECGITLLSLDPEDTGNWTCSIEEYVLLGSRGSGRTVEGRVDVTVRTSTTTTTPPYTTPHTTTTSQTTESLAEEDERLYDEFDEIVDVPDLEVPVPIPQVNREEIVASSSASVVIGVICAVIILALVLVSALLYRRRRLQHQGQDRAAAVVYERDAQAVNDQKTMVPGGAASVAITGNSGSHLHEFFPPTIRYSNSPHRESNA